jgi:CheY-like chemotaxis protein
LVRRLKKSQRHIRGQSRLLARSRRAAEAANAAKSEFLANMSHEIRTPMTAILGFAEVLLEQLTAPDQVDALRTIRRNGHYLLGLINDILDLSKIEAGKLTLESIATAPAQLVRDVLELLRIRAAEKNLSLQARFEGPIPELIQTDPTRLRQILINLASNAIKFTQQGGVTIGVRLLNDGEQPWLRFDITDTGIGMTPEQAARIFHPFVQADTSTTRRFGGTGLGLAISRRLVEMLGGEISFTTAPGHGSTFTVTIPTGSLHDVRCWQPDHRPAPLPVATAAPTSAAAPSPGLSQAPLEGRRILLAEDGPDNQRLIALLLRKSGAEVELAENGQQARDKALAAAAQGRPFDVILMDMQMPVLDGYDATRQLRQGGYTAPILALTAHAMSGDRQHCLDAGCDDYAAKPVDRKQLMDVVVQWCAAGEQYEPTRSSPPCTP